LGVVLQSRATTCLPSPGARSSRPISWTRDEHRALRQQVPFRVAMVAGSDFDVDVAAPPTARHL
jgi:hypothetical protein